MTQVSNNVGLELVPIEAITSRVSIRSVKRSGVERIKTSMRKFGFLPQHALLVTRKADGTYELEDGNHRLEAATELDITEVPVHILEGELTDNDKKRIARESNEAAGTLILTALVDDAEFVWSEVKLGKKLAEIAEMLGWSESKVKQYSALAAINHGAWEIIAATLERNERLLNEESDEKVTIVTFSEGLLRNILNLTAEQQIELVRTLVSGEITKGQFKTLAASYRASNDVERYVAENPEVLDEATVLAKQEAIAEKEAEIAKVRNQLEELQEQIRYEALPREEQIAYLEEKILFNCEKLREIKISEWEDVKSLARIELEYGNGLNQRAKEHDEEYCGPYTQWLAGFLASSEQELEAIMCNAEWYKDTPVEEIPPMALLSIGCKRIEASYVSRSDEVRQWASCLGDNVKGFLRGRIRSAIKEGKEVNEKESKHDFAKATRFLRSQYGVNAEQNIRKLQEFATCYEDTPVDEIPWLEVSEAVVHHLAVA